MITVSEGLLAAAGAGIGVGAAGASGVLLWMLVSLLRWRGYVRHKGLDHRQPGATDLLRELRAMAQIGWWHLRALGRDGALAPAGATGRPVLCVHGFTQNGTNFWGLRQALWRRGRASRAVSLGRPGRPIERYAARLREVLDEMADRHEAFDVVAHSMGGVVLRYVLDREPRLANHVVRVVTLGSPHAGTAASRGLPLFLLPEVVQIGRRSVWLAALPPLGRVAPSARRVTIAGRGDLVVYPVDTCHEPDAVRVELDGVGHAGLLADPRVFAIVADALD